MAIMKKQEKKKILPALTWDQDPGNYLRKPRITKVPNPEFAIKDVTTCLLSSVQLLSRVQLFATP